MTLNGLADNDSLQVDLSGGDPIADTNGLTFNGGTQSGDPGDSLSTTRTSRRSSTPAPPPT
jgi:hypothetical protein